jgi:hypothetical protein
MKQKAREKEERLTMENTEGKLTLGMKESKRCLSKEGIP